jgi:hypothetical protein
MEGAAMIQVPVVVGLTLCEMMSVDPERGRVSLDGVFHTLRLSDFPLEPRRFTVYAALTDGVGEGLLKLTVTRLQTNRIIYSFRRWFAFPSDRLEPVNMEIRVTRCIFPASGRYAFALLFDDEMAAERTVHILEKTS